MSLSLGQFAELYRRYRERGDAPHTRRWRKTHKKLAPSTLKLHLLVIRYLRAYFGDEQTVEGLTPLALEDWLDAIAAGQLTHVQQWAGREGKAPGEQGMRRLIRDAHAVFGWARSNGFIDENPLADFQGRALASDPNPYVSVETMRAICQHAYSRPWADLWRLCRLAGLRRGEALALPWFGHQTDRDGRTRWVGVDWAHHRLCVVATKTHYYREVPISRELYDALTETLALAAPGQDRVVPLSGNNCNKMIFRAMDKAQVSRWRKPYQSLRSSCENDWKEMGVAEATYCAWLGHSTRVSRDHYAAPTDREYRQITGE